MKIVVIGANGQLGTDLCRVLARQDTPVVPLLHRDLDVTNPAHLDHMLNSIRPGMVISTAAYHKVEECEQQPALSFAVNAIGPRNLALACKRNHTVLVHFSTDYVFDGACKKPYIETDLPHPLNVYGISKLAGENMVALTWERYFVIRTCGLYGVA